MPIQEVKMKNSMQEEPSNILIKSIIDFLPHYIFWKDRNSIFLGCNEIFAKSAGLESADEIIGKSDYDLPWSKEESDKYRFDDKEVMDSAVPKLNIEETQTFPDGKQITLLTSKVPLVGHDNSIVGVACIYSDISDKKQKEIELEKAKNLALLSSKAKSEFIANISHDILTPITGILGLAQSIKKHSQDEENRQDAQLLISATEQLLNLLNEIIEVVRLEAGTMVNNNEDFDLLTMIAHQTELLLPAFHEKNLKYNTQIDANVPHYLYGNRTYLNRSILNLLGNAIKFTNSGKISLSIRLKERSEIDNTVLLEITVADTGIGIPEDKFESIFENFSRLSPSYEGRYSGHGLGLYTVKRYVEDMGGTIKVESKLGKGSRFILTLPFTIGKATTTTVQRIYDNPDIKNLTADLNRNKILLLNKKHLDKKQAIARTLLVEDNYIAARMAMNLLTEHGCYVTHAADSCSAIELASSEQFDLILMDIGLPEVSGLELSKQIRKLPGYSKTPIVALTGHMVTDEKKKCLDAGMNKMLIKPLTTTAVENLLATYITQTD